MTDIEKNLLRIHTELAQSAVDCLREPSDITLLAVSKTKPVEDIRKAFEVGQRDFGENYLQESLAKIDLLQDLEIVWHYIGAIQSNKAKQIAEHFSWVHTLDRIKVAQRLSQCRPPKRGPLQVCIQVNIDNELSKAGCLPERVVDLAAQVSDLPNLKLRGLMAIPRPHSDTEPYKRMSELLLQANRQCGLQLDTLSMGMSKDMALAVKGGATIVRIGTAIFGKREQK